MMLDIIANFKYKIQSETRSLLNYYHSKAIRSVLRDFTYAGDGIITSQFLPFKDSKIESAFRDSFEMVPEKHSTLRSIEWRFHILIWAMKQTRGIPGSVVECGVWYGILSRALLNYFGTSEKRSFLLFDSWGEPGFQILGPYKRKSYLEDIFSIVEKRFPDQNVTLIRGSLPNSIDEFDTGQISLLMIDLNSGSLESEILEKLWDRIPIKGIVYFDDYGQNFPLVREAIDKFILEYKQSLLVFPTGQAIVIKV